MKRLIRKTNYDEQWQLSFENPNTPLLHARFFPAQMHVDAYDEIVNTAVLPSNISD
jgi:hypothetical protein